MILVLDIGNTRLKWARARAGRLMESGSLAHGRGAGALLDAPARAGPGFERVLVANVAGEALRARLAAEVRARFALDAEFVAPTACRYGVRCAYADPSRLGVDRWVGLIAARRLVAGPAAVVSVGTAATMDAMTADGRHLGGLILPGPKLMAEALDLHTGRIGATEPARGKPEGVDLLGKSTDEAVGHAALLAIAAAFDRAIGVAVAVMPSKPRVLLTGGDAERLSAWLETETEIRADLVLEGLASIAESSEKGSTG